METIIAWLLPFMIGVLVLSVVMQLLWAWTISAIAEKTGQSELMQVLAWIPILQVAPVIAAGGGSIGLFLLGTLGMILGVVAFAIVSSALGSGLGTLVGGVAMAAATLLCVFYVARLFWNTAESRGLSGWVGVLLLIPFVNLFVYPYIAFHDGWTAPHKVGLAIGLVLAIASAAPSLRTIRDLQEGTGELAAQLAMLAEDPELADLESALQQQLASELARQLAENGEMPFEIHMEGAKEPSSFAVALPSWESKRWQMGSKESQAQPDASASIRALLSMKDRFEALDELSEPARLRQPGGRARAQELLHVLRTELDAHHGVLDRETFEELASHLDEIAALVEPAASGQLGSRGSARSGGGAAGDARTPGPAAIASYAERELLPTRPFPVQPSNECPPGTELRTKTDERGDEEWCQQLEASGGLRHGWYARYQANGRPESLGEYQNGLRVGVWTRFHPSGEVRAQAQFVKGLQHGWLLTFDESGARTKAVRFERGAPAP